MRAHLLLALVARAAAQRTGARGGADTHHPTSTSNHHPAPSFCGNKTSDGWIYPV